MIYKTYALFRNITLGLFAAIIYASLSFSAVHAAQEETPIAIGGIDLPDFLPGGNWTLRGSYERVVHGSPDKVEVTKFYSPRPAGARSYAVVEQWEPNKVPTVRGGYISNSTVANQVYKLGQLDWSGSRRVVVEGENNCKANIYKFKYLEKQKTIFHTCGANTGASALPNVSSQEINVKNNFEGLATFIKRHGTRVAESEVLYQSSFNVARNGTARQSSTAWGGVASRAIDGNRSGDWNDGSVTHTDVAGQPYWEVDLGKITDISNIRLWNRTNCCADRLRQAQILVSDDPIKSGLFPNAGRQKGVETYTIQGTLTSDNKIIPINRTGRYIRVQIYNPRGANILSLAEVEVLTERKHWWTGSYAVGDYYNYAQESSVKVKQSSTYGSSVASIAIDGDTSGHGEHKVTHTQLEDHPWWEIDLGRVVDNIETINIFNRTDCCSNRLDKFNVLVSDKPFGSTSLTEAGYPQEVYWWSEKNAAKKKNEVPVDRSGRYIRIQLSRIQSGRSSFLSLAEVQVLVGSDTKVNNPAVKASYNYIKEESTAVAEQSSTSGPGVASRAIDNNISGHWYDNSVTHTGWQKNAWWEVDLGRVVHIDSLRIFNRTDCCRGRLNNFHVFVADDSFYSAELYKTQLQHGIFEVNRHTAKDQNDIPVNRTGRYIRVQLGGTNYLSLAEVQVLLN